MAQNLEETAPVNCVGPDYRPENEKPTATTSTQVSYDNVHILSPTPQLIALLTYDCILPLINNSVFILNVCASQYDSR
jgi:hypothetical protein